MSRKRAMAIEAASNPIKPKKLSEVKDRDDKRFMIEDAARTFKRFGEIEQEIAIIKADTELFTAAKKVLEQEMANTKAAIKS